MSAQLHKNRLKGSLDRSKEFLSREIWSMDLGGLPTFRALLYKVSRVFFLAGHGFVKDRSLIRASALTYMTVLSLVPLLAFAFSVAKGLGAYDQLLTGTVEPFLDETFGVGEPEPGAEQTAPAAMLELRKAIDTVLRFVQDTNFASLGTFGLLILVYTVVKLLSSVEQAFNDIWGVHKPRTLMRKLADYLSILVIVPILLIAGTAVAASLRSPTVIGFLRERLNLGPLADAYLGLSSLAALWLAFTFVYLFMPNTRVRILSAFLGGVAGGTLWQLMQVLHVKFQVGMAKYNAIYSTFAAFPIFLFWIFVCWVTVLVGAHLAYAHQNEPAYRQIVRAREHDHAFRESIALRAMARIALRFLGGEPPLRAPALAKELGVPDRSLENVLQKLCDADILAMAEDEAFVDTFLPARDLERITVMDVLDALEGRHGPLELEQQGPVDRAVEDLLDRYEVERREAPHNYTMRALAEACQARLAAAAEPSATQAAPAGDAASGVAAEGAG